VIISLSEDDLQVWAQMCVSLWSETVELFFDERKQGKFQNEFLYIVEDEAVAFISLSLRSDYVEGTKTSPVGYIEGIYVKPKFRNQGIAKKLVEFAKIWSAEKGCSELASDAEIENTDSQKFHNKVGFKEASTIVHFTMEI